MYERLKEYPSIPAVVKKAGGTALKTVAALGVTFAAIHVAPDLISGTFLHDVPLAGGLMQWAANSTDWITSNLSSGLAGLMSGVNSHVTVLPNMLIHNPVTENVLSRLPHPNNVLTQNDLVVTEGAAALAGVGSFLKWGTKLVLPAEKVNAPNASELQAGGRIVSALQGTGKRRYKGLNATEIAVEVAAKAADLRKGQIDKSALWARTVGVGLAPLLRKVVNPNWAARTTLKKEIYRGLPGTFLHRWWGLTDSTVAEWIKKAPGIGDTFNFVTDMGDYIVGGLLPKQDIFGTRHHGVENLLLDGFATAVGDFMDFLPLLTSNDIKETVEVIGRPSLKSAALAPEVDNAAAIIIGSKVQQAPRRYTRVPKKA